MPFIFNRQPIDRVANVYIGIDFGATYTKLAFRVMDAGTNTLAGRIKTIQIENPEQGGQTTRYYPSKLGFNSKNGELIFHDFKQSNIEEVKYFKYSILNTILPTTGAIQRVKTKNAIPCLCAAFFLAHMIKIIKGDVEKSDDVRNYNELKWHINMGKPANKFNEKSYHIYDEVLQIAWQLVEGYSGFIQHKIKLEELDGKYTELRTQVNSSPNPNLHTVPELYAEIVAFLQSSSVDQGLYTVVDVGGATVDLAVFFKEISNNIPSIRCVAQEVSPVGYEIFRQDSNNIENVQRIDFCYGNALTDVYQRHRFLIQNLQRHKVFFMGGARGVKFYREHVLGMSEVHVQNFINFPDTIEVDIVDFLSSNRNTFKSNLNTDFLDQRLLIAQMLAQPFVEIPKLKGAPWF